MLKDHGYSLKKNTFAQDGICIYEDGFGNTVFCKNESDDAGYRFTAKLRFADENVKAEPLHISIPMVDDSEGANLHLDFLDGKEHGGEDIQGAIEMYTFIVQRWIDLMYDIAALRIGVQDDKDARKRLDNLADYEEIDEVVRLMLFAH